MYANISEFIFAIYKDTQETNYCFMLHLLMINTSHNILSVVNTKTLRHCRHKSGLKRQQYIKQQQRFSILIQCTNE